MTTLEERGLFWWADDATPAGQLAPTSCVSGILKIGDDGSSSLQLDGYLPRKHGPIPLGVNHLPRNKCIRGLLTGSGQHVLLVGLTSIPSFPIDRYIAFACLLSETLPISEKLIFKQVIIPLSGYEEWLRLTGFKVVKTRHMLVAKHRLPKVMSYRVSSGTFTLKLNFRTDILHTTSGTEVSMKETALGFLRFKRPLDLDGVISHYVFFEELMILLTTVDSSLDWPWVMTTKNAKCRAYFKKLRERSGRAAVTARECITNFSQLRGSFGSIWERWRSEREELRSGLYLYLITRSGMRLYVEHRFLFLVWGIEAFHRKKYEKNTRQRQRR